MENKIIFQIKKIENLLTRMVIKYAGVPKNIPTSTQMQIMAYILHNSNKNIYQKDLEKVLNLRRATVSGVLQTMENNNLITRVTSEEDLRIKRIVLNESTKKSFLSHEEKMKQIEKLMTKDISKEELKVFMDVLKKIENNIMNNIN